MGHPLLWQGLIELLSNATADEMRPRVRFLELTTSSRNWAIRLSLHSHPPCSHPTDVAFDGIPSCANKRLLQTILQDEWNSSCLVQSDCCNLVSSIFSQHHYFDSEEDAVAVAANAGTQLCFNCGDREERILRQSLNDSKVAEAVLESALARTFLTQIKCGLASFRKV